MNAAGLVVLAVGALSTICGAACASARLFPAPAPLADRAVATPLLALSVAVAIVRLLGLIHALTPVATLAATLLVAGLLVVGAGSEARRLVVSDIGRARAIAWLALAGGTWSAAAWTGLAALTAAALAASLFTTWAWDALGYHLPIVLDAIRVHTFRWVPTHVPYINVYPRAVEAFFVWCRLQLFDDDLLDLAQAPFAIGAAIVIAAIARRAGASAPRAAAWGTVLLAVPLVALEMATSYVDIAYATLLLAAAYFATGALDARGTFLWALATALLLASKPCAPPAVAVLSILVMVRSGRSGHLLRGSLAVASVALFGGDRYVMNVIAHGNPIWPVAMRIGPILLPGTDAADTLYMQGVPEPYAHYGWLRRVLSSVFMQPPIYLYDMRLGGFGPLVAYALAPLTLLGALGALGGLRPGAMRGRGRRPRASVIAPVLLITVCTLATPAAHWLRFALALPAALLVLVVVTTDAWPAAARRGADLVIALTAAVGLWRALPGFTNGGPSLWSALRMAAPARVSVVSVDGHEAAWIDMRARVGDDEAVAYDRTFALPGLLYRHDGKGRVVYLDEDSPARVLSRIDAERARIVIAGDGEPAQDAIASARDRFRILFRCPLDPCTVYEVTGTRPRPSAP